MLIFYLKPSRTDDPFKACLTLLSHDRDKWDRVYCSDAAREYQVGENSSCKFDRLGRRDFMKNSFEAMRIRNDMSGIGIYVNRIMRCFK